MKNLYNNLSGMRTSISGFWSNYLIFFILGVFALSVFEKGTFVLLLNGNANPGLDSFFKFITHFGTGSVFAIVAIVLCFFRYNYGLLFVINFLVSSIFVLIFKQLLFPDVPRPTAFFDDPTILNLIEGFSYHSKRSFPSGHTTTAFAMFSLFAWIVKRQSFSTFFFLTALMVGISRMYLLQHFFVDVFAGAVFGVISTLITLGIYKKWLVCNEKLNRKIPSSFLFGVKRRF